MLLKKWLLIDSHIPEITQQKHNKKKITDWEETKSYIERWDVCIPLQKSKWMVGAWDKPEEYQVKK